MKQLLLFALMILTVSTLSAQQVSLFDKEREARAYIDYDKEATLFMWDGTPVAYIEKKGKNLCIFGFDGDFLGWYEDGVVYDKKGYVVGAREGASSMIPHIKTERIKGIQKTIPTRRMVTSFTTTKPIFKRQWSNTSLTELLYFGKK